ncbi:MAG TPA: 50S ribosomal protein L4 [Solirubrobacteraceae bacterium]|nr:50S ribosomal protein L4 [Solirubrobacteraceae bacterium]
MPEAPVLGAPSSGAGGKGAKLSLDEEAFGQRFLGALVHEAVRAELNARRRGTAATRPRHELSGGGRKPWRQKGTGRARAGSNRSPLWTGGATLFGPQPRSYTVKVNRRERRAALRSALSLHAERGSLGILDAAALPEAPSTKAAAAILSEWGGSLPALVVLGEQESTAALSFRNLARVAVLAEPDVGVADLVGAASVLVSTSALDGLTARARGRDASSRRRATTTPTPTSAPTSTPTSASASPDEAG